MSAEFRVEVLFTPADFAALSQRDLSQTICVVFDVLRATSSMVTALAHGADAIVPVVSIDNALRARRERADVLLAGERNGVRITGQANQFQFGNSPREFAGEHVRGKTLVMTTTNGTRAVRACAHARHVLIGAFVNLHATVRQVRELLPGLIGLTSEPEKSVLLLLVCAGTYERAAYEDVLCAGAVCDLLDADAEKATDSALMACDAYRRERGSLEEAISRSENGRRLLQSDDLRDDVGFCATVDRFDIAAGMQRSGIVRLSHSRRPGFDVEF